MDVIPEWVFDAARWFHLFEKSHTPISLGRAAWLPGAYIEIMEEFATAAADEKAAASK